LLEAAAILLALSVFLLLRSDLKNGPICTFVWLLNLAGATSLLIALFEIQRTSSKEDIKGHVHDDAQEAYGHFIHLVKESSFIRGPRLSFALLAVGHLVELLHLFCTSRFRYKRYILSLLCITSGFAILLLLDHYLYMMLVCFLFVAHSLFQYMALFYYKRPLEEEEECEAEELDDMLDTYAFLLTSDDVKTWHFGFFVFFMQAGLAVMILIDQVFLGETNVPLDAPTERNQFVTFAQFYGLILVLFWQSDIHASVRMLGMLWYNGGNWPYEKIMAKDGSFGTWLKRVLFPNILRLIGGILVLTTSFVIIVQSDGVIDLFKDFTALILISEIDNIAFSLASQHYFGRKMKEEADKIKEIKLVDNSNIRIFKIPVRLFVCLLIFLSMLVGWSYFVYGQYSNRFFVLKEYPNCSVEYPFLIRDGICNNFEPYFTEDCGYDGGDCDAFFTKYPDCTAEPAEWIGDDLCDNLEPFNTEECGYDGGDCINFNSQYPYCTAESAFWIGDGECDDIEPYNTEECGYDGGDCL